jgi:hypothetical protein
MIVEHTFVTALPVEEAFAVVEKILEPLSFSRKLESGSVREWKRGKEDAERATRLNDFPQQVRMDFDRGRVAIAASVDQGRRPHKLPPLLMVALTLAAERALVLRQPTPEASEDVLRLQEKITRRDRRVRIAFVLTIVTILGLFAAAIIAASVHGR